MSVLAHRCQPNLIKHTAPILRSYFRAMSWFGVPILRFGRAITHFTRAVAFERAIAGSVRDAGPTFTVSPLGSVAMFLQRSVEAFVRRGSCKVVGQQAKQSGPRRSVAHTLIGKGRAKSDQHSRQNRRDSAQVIRLSHIPDEKCVNKTRAYAGDFSWL